MAPTQDHPTRLGKYEILSVLGKGGMGIVYKARDAVIDRIVAIKTITGQASEGLGETVERLLMEARSAGRLHHPNIVTVFDYGEENGVAYIVLEYAEGADLGQLIAAKHPLSLPAKIDLLLQICNGLGFAHDAGVTHRDMKPSNVRITPNGVAKILDFGLARYDDTQLTKTGFISGTIAYMSPERMNGQAGKSDDIFALGAVAYELLTYERAFPGTTPPEIMFKIMTQTPPPPSQVAELPESLDEVILECLAREIRDRYETAYDFASAIEEAFETPEAQAFVLSEERSTEFREALTTWVAPRRTTRGSRSVDMLTPRRSVSLPLTTTDVDVAVAKTQIGATPPPIPTDDAITAIKTPRAPMPMTEIMPSPEPVTEIHPVAKKRSPIAAIAAVAVIAILAAALFAMRSKPAAPSPSAVAQQVTAAPTTTVPTTSEPPTLANPVQPAVKPVVTTTRPSAPTQQPVVVVEMPTPAPAPAPVPVPVPPQPQPVVENRPTPPPAPVPQPQPAANPRAEISAFMNRVASAYQSHDAAFFRDHHLRYTDAMGNAVKNSPSTKVEIAIESVDVVGADHARVTATRTDEFGGGAPPARARIVYTLERRDGTWKIAGFARAN